MFGHYLIPCVCVSLLAQRGMAVRHDVQVDRMSFPVEVPVLPPGWQHSEVDQVTARLQFDHAVVSEPCCTLQQFHAVWPKQHCLYHQICYCSYNKMLLVW